MKKCITTKCPITLLEAGAPNLGGEDAGHCAKSTACLLKPVAVAAVAEKPAMRPKRTHRSEAEVAHLLETCRRLRHMGYHKDSDKVEAAI